MELFAYAFDKITAWCRTSQMPNVLTSQTLLLAISQKSLKRLKISKLSAEAFAPIFSGKRSVGTKQERLNHSECKATRTSDVVESWLVKFIDVSLLPGAGITTTDRLYGDANALHVIVVIPATPQVCRLTCIIVQEKNYYKHPNSLGLVFLRTKSVVRMTNCPLWNIILMGTCDLVVNEKNRLLTGMQEWMSEWTKEYRQTNEWICFFQA